MSLLNRKEALDLFNLRSKIGNDPQGMVAVSHSEMATIQSLALRARAKMSQAEIDLCKRLGIFPDGHTS